MDVRLTLPGPQGRIEALLERPAAARPRAVAVLCHPHPLHGGTMENKVVHTLARGFVALGAAALRFNFRGVGGSDGDYGAGAGEVDDARAAAAWARTQCRGVPLILGGFSFGAAVAVNAAMDTTPSAILTVALPFERLGAATPLPDVPWLLIHGADDELIGIDSLIAWLNEQPPGPTLEVVPRADHFFHGKLPALRSAMEAFFGPLLTRAYPAP